MSKETKKVISQEVAINELKDFLKKHNRKDFARGVYTDDKIKEDFIDVIEAIEEGNLIFPKNEAPKYTLYDPLFQNDQNKDLEVSEVVFRTRVRAADKALVMDGLDVKKQQGTYVLKLVSYITQLSMTEVKELSKYDFEVLNQLCSVF